MLSFLKRVYYSIGLHGAPRGTLLHRLHRVFEVGYSKLVGRGLIAPWQGSAERAASFDACPKGKASINIPEDVVVAFRIVGGFGDHLLAARYIRDLLAAAGDFRFDIYCQKPVEAAWIFKNFSQLNECFDEHFSWNRNYASYPLAIYVTSFAVVYTQAADWRRIERTSRRLREICEALDRFRPGFETFISQHPVLDGFLARKYVFMDLQRHTSLQGISGIAYGGERMPIATDTGALAKFGLEGQRYLTIHNGFDTVMQHRVSRDGKATKCYPHYDAVVAGMRKRFPGLHFVQLGSSTSTPIAGVDCSLIGRTSWPEAAEILRHSVLHIDNESGLVHLAASVGAKSCVLFGPTDVEFFSYKDNINLKSNFCGGCWWTTADWLSRCPRGFAEPRCLSELKPETVVEAVTHYLSTTWKVKVYEGAGEYPEASSVPDAVQAFKSAG